MNAARKISIYLITTAVLFFTLSFFSIYKVNSLVVTNKDKTHYVYLSDYNISDVELEKISEELSKIEEEIINRDISFDINGVIYKYKIKSLGITINKEEIKEKIANYEENLDYWTLYNSYSKDNFDKITYNYEFVIDEQKLNEFLIKLENIVNVTPEKGELFMDENRELKYINETIGYKLDREKSKELIINNFSNSNYKDWLTLVGERYYTDDIYKTIDTKISSFTTLFDDTVSRKYNLIAGASFIDGKIVEPHAEFSFYNNAGPFNKKGYVSYLGIKGNGVCQVATTLYNAQLLAGLTTVKRYHHGIKSVYVDGGLDATVSAGPSGVLDYKFRNDYEYPVYISAYVDGGKLTVEMWSNSNATEGKTFKTESVKYGYGSYRAYRHTYKDGELINTEDLGAAHYFSE